MKTINKLLCILTILTLLTACGDGGSAATAPSAESTPQGNEITVTDQAGREVTITGPVERLVSGYYISSSACIALGLTDKMVGIEAKAASRPIYKMAAPSLPDLPSVGSAKEFNLEGCIALEPDLVILPKRLADQASTMSDLGIPVILVNPESRRELADMITLIGAATGTGDRAAQLIEYYNGEYDAAAQLTREITDKPTVYLGGNGSCLTTAPGGMYQSTLIQAAGGINAAGDIEGSGWVDVSYEQLLAMNPDIIVIPSEAVYSREDVVSDAQLQDVAAVQEGRVYQMPKDFEAWDSPVPSCTLGMKWLLSALHREVYSMEQVQADAAAFYQTFYGVEIDTSLIGK